MLTSANRLFLAILLAATLEGSAFTTHQYRTATAAAATHSVPATQLYLQSFDNNNEANTRRSVLQQSLLAAGSIIMFPSVGSAMDLPKVGGPIQFGDESIMSPKAHGTSAKPVQDDLLYGVNNKLADKICNYNRHFAESGGSFTSTNFEDRVLEAKGPLTFYDSVTGKPLFVAPINRSPEEFLKESEIHGWPSFRDDEVVWENVRVLKNSGETVSVDGTHLGHNLPDRKGNRYCINLVSVAGKPKTA